LGVNAGKTLFAQLMEFVPWTSFARIVRRYGGDSGVRPLACTEQFRVMAFAQLTWRESLRDIEATLSANATKLYAMGFRAAVKRSTLADATYVLIAIVAKQLQLDAAPYTCLQILSVSVLEKTQLSCALRADPEPTESPDSGNQLILFRI
jgi:hypothetical protein